MRCLPSHPHHTPSLTPQFHSSMLALGSRMTTTTSCITLNADRRPAGRSQPRTYPPLSPYHALTLYQFSSRLRSTSAVLALKLSTVQLHLYFFCSYVYVSGFGCIPTTVQSPRRAPYGAGLLYRCYPAAVYHRSTATKYLYKYSIPSTRRVMEVHC